MYCFSLYCTVQNKAPNFQKPMYIVTYIMKRSNIKENARNTHANGLQSDVECNFEYPSLGQPVGSSFPLPFSNTLVTSGPRSARGCGHISHSLSTVQWSSGETAR